MTGVARRVFADKQIWTCRASSSGNGWKIWFVYPIYLDEFKLIGHALLVAHQQKSNNTCRRLFSRRINFSWNTPLAKWYPSSRHYMGFVSIPPRVCFAYMGMKRTFGAFVVLAVIEIIKQTRSLYFISCKEGVLGVLSNNQSLYRIAFAQIQPYSNQISRTYFYHSNLLILYKLYIHT